MDISELLRQTEERLERIQTNNLQTGERERGRDSFQELSVDTAGHQQASQETKIKYL